MKSLFIKYKSVIKFILTFLLVYIGMSLLYKLYLNASVGSQYFPDYITNLVAYQCQALLNFINYNTELVKHLTEPSIKLIIRGHYLARVVEGCNAVSVIILFMAFVIAFSGKLKTTIIFLLSGSVIIYVVNLIRIVLISVALYHFPKQSEVLHSVVFPGIIYGMVFLLWMFWVNRFSNIGKNNE
ncbi:exosortase family protein XrtF [Lacinutrix venerupis]|uniref:Exosortase family protein XrtF n=1 Tax=Lacinutrix venerupis TaxID=1486034 RepID=A0AAC9PXS0_9FLAO|nr:exosortase family protein XrtF [Lacinutrix venerupis]APY01148.1 exosortase family protein XrtF [Lacinutrix venerupis]